MKEIEFILVTEENKNLAIKIAKEIFPYEVSPKGIFLPRNKIKRTIDSSNKLGEFFIIKDGRFNAGIIGYSYNNHLPKFDELWIDYFGIRKKHRGSGLGKKVLLKTLSLMKEFNVNLQTVKLYSSNIAEEKDSHHLYRCVGFKIYAHKNEKPDHIYYFKMEV